MDLGRAADIFLFVVLFHSNYNETKIKTIFKK